MPPLSIRAFGVFKVAMGRCMLATFAYGRCCKGGCSPALSGGSAQGDGESESSRHRLPSSWKMHTKNQLHVAQPHPGHRLSKSTLFPPQSVSQRELPTGDSGAIQSEAPDWAECPRQVRESRRQGAQGHLLRGSLWASWHSELYGSSSRSESWNLNAQWSQTELGSNIASVTYDHMVLGTGDKTKIMRYSSQMKKAPDTVLSVFHECAYGVANSQRWILLLSPSLYK